MNTVGAEQQLAANGRQVIAARCLDQQADTAAVVLNAIALGTMPEADPIRAEAFENSAVEQHVQLTTVDSILRPVIAREQAARLGVDVVAIETHERPLPRLNPYGVEQGVVDPQIVELTDRVGLEVDPDPQWARGADSLEHAAGDAKLVQGQGSDQPANSTTGDQDVVGGCRGQRGGCGHVFSRGHSEGLLLDHGGLAYAEYSEITFTAQARFRA